jgi:hypothetical protein
MFEHRAASGKLLGALGLALLVILSVGVAAIGGGAGQTLTKVAAVGRLAAMRVTSNTPRLPADTTVIGARPAAVTVSGPKAAIASSASILTPANVTARPVHPTTSSTPAAAPAHGAPAPVAGATLAPRRQPTAAEVSGAIKAVHQLVPFFTPTAVQVARVGNQVCTAFDQGLTFSQVKSKVSALLGPWSWLLPSSVASQGVRVTVDLYCPGYASKLV